MPPKKRPATKAQPALHQTTIDLTTPTSKRPRKNDTADVIVLDQPDTDAESSPPPTAKRLRKNPDSSSSSSSGAPSSSAPNRKSIGKSHPIPTAAAATASATTTAGTTATPATPPEDTTPVQNVLMWFRTDLRMDDNRALSAATALARTVGKSVLAVYVISPQDHRMHDDAPIKVQFRLRNLEMLREKLDKELNVPLAVLTVERRKEIPMRLLEFAKNWEVSHLFWNVEYEVDESRRDASITELFTHHRLSTRPHHDQCIVQPGHILTKGLTPYTVFTPFKASWLNHLETQKSPTTPGSLALLDQAPTPTSNPSTARNAHASLFTDPAFAIPASLPSLPLPAHQKNLIQTLYPPGEPAAHARLTAFLTTKIASYHLARDQPAKDGCSALSPYLAAGVISARQCLRAARRANGGKLRTGKEGVVGWVSELAWRDFYRHVLFHFPRVCMGRAFKQETEKVEWAEDPRGVKFKAWCEGKTGFPIVDAGMRQMKEIGWMHNRVRMCAAMFLSKDLLLDWRMGEKFFMQHLIDGDFASNNGGWQWAASTGTDAQPYFRVFNPHLQSERFDSEGEYVRRWIPELKEVRVPAVHDPSGALVKEEFEKLGYAYPIVDHKQARERALAAYKKALAK